ncbi:MAG TPA: phosphotransferase family protein [Nocardioides sp.]|uniref:phosphotransferase family protein n=1 Tax=Nocardioides sp. TaxID=35761 RepID=UPI002F3EA8EF
MSRPDETRPVRDEDAIDVAAVVGWLHQHADGEVPVGVPEVRQFPGGASNLTYLLRWPSADGEPRELILRRPPPGAKARGAHDMAREYLIQHALGPVYPYVAGMVALCRDESVLGSDFYVMERLPGLILRRDPPFELAPEAASRLCEDAWEALALLHEVEVSGVPELSSLGRGEGYVGRQVAGWTDRLGRAATDDLGDWRDVTTWLDDQQPRDSGQCLIHNDWRFDNLVLDADLRVTGVLDWEMATVGDPLMDLGGALAYWIQADDDAFFRDLRRQPTTVPGMWTRGQVVEWYCRRRGLAVTREAWRFYEAFGLFRLAVILQQIWYRYVLGQTHNPAYAGFGAAVRHLEQRTRRVVSGEARG